MDLKKITDDLSPDWESVQTLLRESLLSDCELLNKINKYLLENMGKQMRPMMGLLAARTCGAVSKKTITVCVVSEMIHCATLLHDDVADNSDKRRGRATVHKIFTPAASVLTGDFWLAKALALVADLNDNKVLQYYVKAVEELSKGELIQMDKSIKMDTTIDDYYKIISGKTASLFGSVILSSASTAGANEEQLKNLADYALNLGIAFQIRDDIFDYSPKLETGKPAGTDIKEKKLTLPLLKALENVSASKSDKVINLLRSVEFVNDEIAGEIIDFVRENDGLAMSQKILQEHCGKAIDALKIFPESSSKKHLAELAEYVALREK